VAYNELDTLSPSRVSGRFRRTASLEIAP